MNKVKCNAVYSCTWAALSQIFSRTPLDHLLLGQYWQFLPGTSSRNSSVKGIFIDKVWINDDVMPRRWHYMVSASHAEWSIYFQKWKRVPSTPKKERRGRHPRVQELFSNLVNTFEISIVIHIGLVFVSCPPAAHSTTNDWNCDYPLVLLFI